MSSNQVLDETQKPGPPNFIPIFDIKRTHINTSHITQIRNNDDSNIGRDIELIHTLNGPTLPYVYITVGAEPYHGLRLKGLNDSGCSSTLLDCSLWTLIPNHETIPRTPHTTHIQEATGPARVVNSESAEVWITFESTDGRMFSFRKTIHLHKNLNDCCYVGSDITGSARTLLTTSHSMLLKGNLAAEYEINITGLTNDVYDIPINTEAKRQNQAPHITYTPPLPKPKIPDQLKPHLPITVYPTGPPPTPAFSAQAKPPTQVTFANEINLAPNQTYIATANIDIVGDMTSRMHDYVHTHFHNVTLVPPTTSNETQMSIHNGHEHHVTLTHGDTFDPKPVGININTVTTNTDGKLNSIHNDPNMTESEKLAQLEKYAEQGACTISATHYVESRPKLQILDQQETIDYTDDQLIDGLKLDHLPPEDQLIVREMFRRNINMLARNEFDVEANPYITAVIELKDDFQPMTSKYIPIPIHLREDAIKLIRYYLKKGVIEYCHEPTPFVSNMLFQRKKSGKIRGILDARIINYNTKKVAVAMTSGQEITGFLTNKRHITTIDISNAYFCLKLSQESKKYTAFYDPDGNRCHFSAAPQGWVNSSWFLNQLLSQILGDLQGVLFVADDVLIASNSSFMAHLQLVEQVCQRLISANLRANHTKINFLTPNIEFLGLIYNNNTVDIPRARLQGYLDYPYPNTPRKIKTLLASLSYYRKFIPNFAEITRDLHEASLMDPRTFKLTESIKCAVDELKHKLREATALHLPNLSRPYICYSDASSKAIAFTVNQAANPNETIMPNMDLLPVAFLSKMLTKAEQAYSTFKKEALALQYGLTAMDYFFIGHPKIIVYTDAKALIFLRSCKNSNSFLTRVALTLSQYNLEIHHIKGESNHTADALSRQLDESTDTEQTPLRSMTEKEAITLVDKLRVDRGTVITIEEVKNLLLGDPLPSAKATPKPRKPETSTTSLYNTQKGLPITKGAKPIRLPPTKPIRMLALVQDIQVNAMTTRSHAKVDTLEPPQDNTVGELSIGTKILKGGQLTLEDFAQAQKASHNTKQIMYKAQKENTPYKIFGGLLFRTDDNNTLKPVLPECLYDWVIFQEHYGPHGGHRSIEQMYANISKQYYCPTLRSVITNAVQGCFHCLTNKSSPQPKHTINNTLHVTYPRQLWSYDNTGGLSITASGHKLVLIFVDYFSLYTILVPAKTKSGPELMEALKTHVMTPFMPPQSIRMDREPGLVGNKAFIDFAKTNNMQILANAPSHPSSNGQCEARVRCTKQMIRIFIQETKNPNWDEHLPLIQLAMNRTTNRYGYTAEEVMFGMATPSQFDLCRLHQMLLFVSIC